MSSMMVVNRSLGNLVSSREEIFQLDEATTRDAKAVLTAIGEAPERYGLTVGDVFLALAEKRKTFDPARIMLFLHGQVLSLAGTFIGSSLILMCTVFSTVYAVKKGWDLSKSAWATMKRFLPQDDDRQDAATAQDFSMESLDMAMAVVLPGLWPVLSKEAENVINRTAPTVLASAEGQMGPFPADNPAQAILNSLQAMTDAQIDFMADAGVFDAADCAAVKQLRDASF